MKTKDIHIAGASLKLGAILLFWGVLLGKADSGSDPVFDHLEPELLSQAGFLSLLTAIVFYLFHFLTLRFRSKKK